MKNILNLFLCFLISIPFSFGQNTVTLNIHVSDSFENPVDNVLITVFGDSACGDSLFIQTYTDADGSATLEFLPDCESGNITIQATCPNGNLPILIPDTWTPNSLIINLDILALCDADPVIDCIDPSLMDTLAICTTEYDPVCGCNGVTYGNSCEAELWGGVTSWTAGACQVDSTGCNNFNANLTSSSNNDGTYDLTVTASGGTPPYVYEWNLGVSANILTGVAPGTYCISIIDSQGCIVSTCSDVGGGTNPTDSCGVWIYYEETPNAGDIFSIEAEAIGAAPFTYSWSTGETTQSILATEGTYCVSVFDAVGCASTSCADVIQDTIWTGGNDCYDWSVIDFDADCPEVYDPVCGCDGVTYDNACFAEYCFGIIEWTPGPCLNTGSNDNSTDTLGNCSASFDYTIEETGSDVVTLTFSANVEGTAPFWYSWSLGNNESSTDQTFSYDVILQDSFTILPICLFTEDFDSCTVYVCETIIIDIDPDGIIGGTITDSDGLVGDNDIKAKSGNGDPLPNTTVTLLNISGNVLETTETDEAGKYSFDKLYFGDYFVQVLVDGIEHEPFPVKLNPINQNISNTDFEVSKTGVQTTSIQELTTINEVTLFPNPVSDQLTVQFNGLTKEAVQMVIYDVNGQRMHRETRTTLIGTQQWSIPVSDLSEGIYMLSIQSDNGVISQRFVK